MQSVADSMNEALEELKRVDHLIYVSLKYTRTVDVIINILSRMVDAYTHMIDALLVFAGEKMTNEPESAIERADLAKQMYGNDDLCVDNMQLYKLLRKLLRARHVVRENEYRRHVTMKTFIEGREEIVNIDIITNYYLFQRDFILQVKGIVDNVIPTEINEQETFQSQPPEWMTEEPEPAPPKEPVMTTQRTPPTKTTVKIRPVGAPPRKRSPRPKKYKIQIPKSKNSITLPLEYDPALRKEMQKEAERIAKEAREKEKKLAKKKVVKKGKKKAKKVKKATKKKVKKKAVKKKPVKKGKKKVKKKAVKKVKKAKKVTKKKVKKKGIVRKVLRAVKKATRKR